MIDITKEETHTLVTITYFKDNKLINNRSFFFMYQARNALLLEGFLPSEDANIWESKFPGMLAIIEKPIFRGTMYAV